MMNSVSAETNLYVTYTYNIPNELTKALSFL